MRKKHADLLLLLLLTRSLCCLQKNEGVHLEKLVCNNHGYRKELVCNDHGYWKKPVRNNHADRRKVDSDNNEDHPVEKVGNNHVYHKKVRDSICHSVLVVRGNICRFLWKAADNSDRQL